MEQLTYERLQDNLKRLKLFKAVEILDDVATITREVLLLDDLLISPITQDDQRELLELLELLEIVEERYDRKSTVITSQLPVRAWHDAMQDPTLADAILDRLVHNAHKIELKGKDSMRKNKFC
jgi:DNA replication protein DnaC